MIKKLRRKFILTNMLLVSLVLVIVFAALVGYNYQRLTSQSLNSMRMALKWDDGTPPPFVVGQGIPNHPEEEFGENPRFSMVPVFVVVLDDDGAPVDVTGGSNIEVSSQVVSQAVAAVGGEDMGRVAGLDLRYLRTVDREGVTRIAFADMSWEWSSLWPLVRSSLLIGALALVGFYLISLFLSGLALRPIQRAWEQQQRFVADASHELKTPLTVILTNTGILLAHRRDSVESQLKWVEYIRDEAQRMQGLVMDLLFLAKGDNLHQDSAKPQPVDLSEQCWSALLPFEPVAFEAGVAMDSQVEPNLLVSGHADQLRRLVTILVDNAVKYAEKGGGVSVRLERGEKATARLTVQNAGPAIPPEHLEHLFERFYRSDDSRARSSGGYGLGLAIAKSITDNHHGTISVRSTEGEGTVFVVKLPLCP